MYREVQFDSLVGPTHHYGGLSLGNNASTMHRGEVSNPRLAAQQGLFKMALIRSLGFTQVVLPPHPRPFFPLLKQAGYHGSEDALLAQVARENPSLLSAAFSASAMWSANAATITPSCDSHDHRLHLTPANLQNKIHRSIEAKQTHHILTQIFSSTQHFCVHPPLPSHELYSDEGAANHTRLHTQENTVHLFAYGRDDDNAHYSQPKKYPARHAKRASTAIVNSHGLSSKHLLVQQNPIGIDAGSFHTDVLAVGSGHLFLMHEYAFVEHQKFLQELHTALGSQLKYHCVANDVLPVEDAVSAYPFNSQLLIHPDGRVLLLAPSSATENPRSCAYLSLLQDEGFIDELHTRDLHQSMQNGGGPACLRLRILMNNEEVNMLSARVQFDDTLEDELHTCVERRYRDRLSFSDLHDPLFWRESIEIIEELEKIFQLKIVSF
jgi:succinylarginine dihydrolase